MVKAFSSGKNKTKQDDEQKSRKKQAKKEAKLMAQVDQAKKDVRKAEQKATKAQTTLQEQQAHLYKLEQELTQFRQAGQAEPVSTTVQSNASNEADNAEIQLSSSTPAEGLNDIVQEDTTSASEASSESASTPIENIPAGLFDEGPGAQVYADISINPPPTEEDLVISSGDGSIPVVTTNEHAWPPPQIREELAESVAEQVAQEHQATANEQNEAPTAAGGQTATDNGHTEENFSITSGDGSMPVITTDEHAWPPPQIREELAESIAEEIAQERQTTAANEQSAAPTAVGGQAATDNGHSADEENFAITSGDGSMPIVTTDEHAWPPPQIREELAESIAGEVAQEHQKADNKQGESSESSTEDEAEGHEDEHEEGSSRPRRPTRRRTRSNTHQNTNKTDQE